jgi:DNA repair exonuclease SbcCD ATPase subunit
LESMKIKEEDLIEKEAIHAGIVNSFINAEQNWGDYVKCNDGLIVDGKSLDMKKMELDNREVTIENAQNTLEQQKHLLVKYKDNRTTIEFNKKVQIEIDKINKTIPDYKGKLEEIEIAMASWNISLGSMNQKIEDLSNSIEKMNRVEEQFRLSSLLKDALSKDGIQLQITKKVIPRVNLEIRKILSHVSGFDVMLEIDDENHDVGIFIDDGSSKRKLDLGSGMETVIGAISIRAALANISLIPRCNLFVIDEGFGALDSDNLNNMNALLGYLKSIFNTVIIISHIDVMQDIVDYQIHVEKTDDGYSKIKVGEKY